MANNVSKKHVYVIDVIYFCNLIYLTSKKQRF